MRPITWLQISDIHMRARDAWSQDIILRALKTSIEADKAQGRILDFALVTGDLAFSGKANEYTLLETFLTEISSASGVPLERFFCVPGNHDIDREKQTLCFAGARKQLVSPNAVDPILAPDDNLATLSKRQSAYRDFQSSFLGAQHRTPTPDGLAYVSSLEIDDVVVAIVGLDSAWLCEGGESDHGRILIGERQVLGALELAAERKPHVVIALAHHPLHLLQEFDRIAALQRINANCDFYHCGHLHQPGAHGAGFDAKACLTIAAGSSFETRESHNTYTVVTLSLDDGIRTLTTVQYDQGQGGFVYSSNQEFPFELRAAAPCDLGELAEAILASSVASSEFAYYLAALLLGKKSEVPIPGGASHFFASVDVLDLQAGALRERTIEFLRFRNALGVFGGRMPLRSLVDQRGLAVDAYATELKARCATDTGLAARLVAHDADARNLVSAQPTSSFAVDLLSDLAASQEWQLLLDQAERHMSSADRTVSTQARRMYALGLAHGANGADKQQAATQYRMLIDEGLAEPEDRAVLVALLHGLGATDDAKAALLDALEVVPSKSHAPLLELGNRLAVETGDRNFRNVLKTAGNGAN